MSEPTGIEKGWCYRLQSGGYFGASGEKDPVIFIVSYGPKNVRYRDFGDPSTSVFDGPIKSHPRVLFDTFSWVLA